MLSWLFLGFRFALRQLGKNPAFTIIVVRTVFSAVVISAITTMFAGYFPARHTTRIDHLVALTYE